MIWMTQYHLSKHSQFHYHSTSTFQIIKKHLQKETNHAIFAVEMIQCDVISFNNYLCFYIIQYRSIRFHIIQDRCTQSDSMLFHIIPDRSIVSIWFHWISYYHSTSLNMLSMIQFDSISLKIVQYNILNMTQFGSISCKIVQYHQHHSRSFRTIRYPSISLNLLRCH